MDGKIKILLLGMVALLVIAYSSLSITHNAHIDAKIGWMHGNCLAIKNANITPQTQLTVVQLDGEKTSAPARITKVATTGEECNALLEDRAIVNKDAGDYFYVVKSANPINLAVGVLATQSTRGLTFASCSTSEGIQFSALKYNAVIWHGYYYLGYDIEPTCQDQ